MSKLQKIETLWDAADEKGAKAMALAYANAKTEIIKELIELVKGNDDFLSLIAEEDEELSSAAMRLL